MNRKIKAMSIALCILLITAVFSGAAEKTMKETDMALLTTTVAQLREECECGTNATQIEVMAGEEDDFDSDPNNPDNPDIPAASPSETLQALFGPGEVGFDYSDTDGEFIHTFEWEDCGNITGACLEVRLKALTLGPTLSNDSFNLLFSDTSYQISYKIWDATTPSGQEETILLDLSGLPAEWALITATTSGSENLLSMLNAKGYLDLYIQDDTSVDYAKLILCCEQNPSISVEKKVSNDGGQTWHEEVNQCVCQNVLFQITVINDGNVALTNIVITDHLPNCLEYVSGPASNGICRTPASEPPLYNLPGTNTPIWMCSELSPGSSAQVTYTAHVVMSGICENQVSVEGECDGQIVYAEDSAVVTGEECEVLCECSTTATQIEVMAGMEDGFDPEVPDNPDNPDIPAASPSSTLQALFGPNTNNLPEVDFDYLQTNGEFIHTFEWEDCGNITGACLEVKLKALNTSMLYNDSLNLLFSGANYSISYKIWEETTPSGQEETILLDLSELPAAGTLITATTSGSVDLLPMLNNEGYLDLYIQDDTSVDYAKLILCCEQNPSISVEKKVSNDGGQTWHEEVNQCVCQNVQVKITVTNDGDSPLNYVKVSDHVPNYLEYQQESADPDPVGVPSDYIEWSFPTQTLQPGYSIEITYTAHVACAGESEDTVLTEGECDNQIVYAEDSAVVTGEECEPCVDITKKVWDPDTGQLVDSIDVPVDTEVTFLITFCNCGTPDLHEIKVVDEFPDCLEYVDSTHPVSSISGNQVVWEFGSLTLHPEDCYEIKVKANVVSQGNCENCAKVSADCQGGGVTDEDCATVIASGGSCLGTILVIFLLCGGLFIVHRKKA